MGVEPSTKVTYSLVDPPLTSLKDPFDDHGPAYGTRSIGRSILVEGKSDQHASMQYVCARL